MSKKQKAIAVPDSAEHYRAVADAAAEAIITINTESTILLANPAAETIFGYSPEELVGRQLTMLMPKYMRLHHRAGVSRYLQTRERHLEWNAVQLSGLHKNGEEIPLEISFLEFVKDGHRFFTGIIRNISERAKLRRDLDDDPDLMSALIHQATVGVSVLNLDGHFTFANERLCQILGRTRDELLKTSIADITHADDLVSSMATFQRAKDLGVNCEIEQRFKLPDGNVVWVHNCESVLVDEAGKARGVMAVTLDVSDRRNQDYKP